MPNKPEKLIFQQSPTIHIAGCEFTNIPIILQHVDTPLMEVVSFEDASFTTQFAIFHSDGTKLARVKGTQIYRTPEGEKAGLKMRHDPLVTACELNGKTLFEVRREKAAALRASAELFSPTGAFVKCEGIDLAGVVIDDQKKEIRIDTSTIQRCGFQNLKIGIWIKGDGTVGIGCN